MNIRSIRSSLRNRYNIYTHFWENRDSVFCSVPMIKKGKGEIKIKINSKLYIGWPRVGFLNNDQTVLFNINGLLEIEGHVQVATGCAFDVGSGAYCSLSNTYINPNTIFIVSHHFTMGARSAISWNCQFIDSDFHQVEYEGRKEPLLGIEIGNHVWIGCNVKVYKGVRIPDDCIIAADSVVKNAFYEPACLIAGNPAVVVKRNVSWK